MTTGFIWNYKQQSERIATNDEYEDLLNSIDSVINQDDGKYIYTHKVHIFYSWFCLKKNELIFINSECNA